MSYEKITKKKNSKRDPSPAPPPSPIRILKILFRFITILSLLCVREYKNDDERLVTAIVYIIYFQIK